MKPRLIVPLKNFSEEEANCRCGCGFSPEPELMLRLQAFIFYLERVYNAPVRCFITGPVRCLKQNKEVYGGLSEPSYHCGLSKGSHKDIHGAAVDVIIEIYIQGQWVRASKNQVAEYAIESKLFGGVGWKKYGSAHQFVHLDIGPVRTF